VSGRNWGDAVVDKSSLVFRVDKKTAFNIAIPDVSQARLLGFHGHLSQHRRTPSTPFEGQHMVARYQAQVHGYCSARVHCSCRLSRHLQTGSLTARPCDHGRHIRHRLPAQ